MFYICYFHLIDFMEARSRFNDSFITAFDLAKNELDVLSWLFLAAMDIFTCLCPLSISEEYIVAIAVILQNNGDLN